MRGFRSEEETLRGSFLLNAVLGLARLQSEEFAAVNRLLSFGLRYEERREYVRVLG